MGWISGDVPPGPGICFCLLPQMRLFMYLPLALVMPFPCALAALLLPSPPFQEERLNAWWLGVAFDEAYPPVCSVLTKHLTFNGHLYE